MANGMTMAERLPLGQLQKLKQFQGPLWRKLFEESALEELELFCKNQGFKPCGHPRHRKSWWRAIVLKRALPCRLETSEDARWRDEEQSRLVKVSQPIGLRVAVDNARTGKLKKPRPQKLKRKRESKSCPPTPQPVELPKATAVPVVKALVNVGSLPRKNWEAGMDQPDFRHLYRYLRR